MVRDQTYDAIWCPRCGMFAAGPWPVAVAEMHECVRAAATEDHATKAVLLDLIAELRSEHTRTGCPEQCGWVYDNCECGEEWGADGCQSSAMEAADRAEKRLKGLTDE